jgi:hypothetical protein
VSELVRIARVRPLEGHWVRIWFTNGVVKDVDLGEALAGGGVFDEIYRRREVLSRCASTPKAARSSGPAASISTPTSSFEAPDGIRIARRIVNEPAIDQS